MRRGEIWRYKPVLDRPDQSLTIEAVIRRRLVECVDTAPAQAMEQIDAALRAAQEL